MPNRTYRELVVWKKAMDLVVETYESTGRFPKDEVYGMTSQMRRAAVSIPANIAEGQGRQSIPEFRQFLSVSYGSLRELETQLMIAIRLKYLPDDRGTALLEMAGEVGRLLNGLSRSLQSGSTRSRHPGD